MAAGNGIRNETSNDAPEFADIDPSPHDRACIESMRRQILEYEAYIAETDAKNEYLQASLQEAMAVVDGYQTGIKAMEQKAHEYD